MSDFMLFKYFFIFCNRITTEKDMFSNFRTLFIEKRNLISSNKTWISLRNSLN
ncbi:hypothetical protein HanPSC8_Chr08g0321101 [Helianthus annuus]|nr:hypothetical protein HanPSC8_Chr08g0321101 [Helianthus annuus]